MFPLGDGIIPRYRYNICLFLCRGSSTACPLFLQQWHAASSALSYRSPVHLPHLSGFNFELGFLPTCRPTTTPAAISPLCDILFPPLEQEIQVSGRRIIFLGRNWEQEKNRHSGREERTKAEPWETANRVTVLLLPVPLSFPHPQKNSVLPATSCGDVDQRHPPDSAVGLGLGIFPILQKPLLNRKAGHTP